MLLRTDILPALAVAVGVALAVHSSPEGTPAPSASVDLAHEPVSFASDVMPILEKHCWECHSGDDVELGLRLDTYEGMMLGSDYGTVIEAGDPDGSLLVDMIESGDMPEEGDPVSPEDLEIIKTWIAEGAENN